MGHTQQGSLAELELGPKGSQNRPDSLETYSYQTNPTCGAAHWSVNPNGASTRAHTSGLGLPPYSPYTESPRKQSQGIHVCPSFPRGRGSCQGYGLCAPLFSPMLPQAIYQTGEGWMPAASPVAWAGLPPLRGQVISVAHPSNWHMSFEDVECGDACLKCN